MITTTKKIVVLGTGGTISGLAMSPCDNVSYVSGEVGIEALLKSVPFKQSRQFEVVGEQVAQLDSKDMSFSVLKTLAYRVNSLMMDDDVTGVVITHGTDTLEETAFFLQKVCIPSKPVVLTCAMRPASSFAPDGPQNLLDSLSVASCPSVSGVFVVCSGRIHSASLVQKIHTYRLDPFDSGESGCVGFVEEGQVRFTDARPCVVRGFISNNLKKVALLPLDDRWPRVEILMNFVGANGLIVDALIGQGVDGIVVAGTGNGTIHHALERALCRAQLSGVSVVVATRCSEGRVLNMPERPFLDSMGLSPVKARIALVLKLLESSGAQSY